MKSTTDVLLAAKALIATPETWCQDVQQRISMSGVHAYCAHGAILVAARMAGVEWQPSAWYLVRAIGVDPRNSESFIRDLTAFNDAPTRTHAEVLAAFDTAVALARRDEEKSP